MSYHVLLCPDCGEELLVEYRETQGGTVAPNLVVVDHRPAMAPPVGPTPSPVAEDAQQEARPPLTTPEGVPVTTTATPTDQVSAPAIESTAVVSEQAPPDATTTDVAATPAAQAHAEETGVDLTQVEGTGKDGTIIKADVVAAASTDTPPAEAAQE